MAMNFKRHYQSHVGKANNACPSGPSLPIEPRANSFWLGANQSLKNLIAIMEFEPMTLQPGQQSSAWSTVPVCLVYSEYSEMSKNVWMSVKVCAYFILQIMDGGIVCHYKDSAYVLINKSAKKHVKYLLKYFPV